MTNNCCYIVGAGDVGRLTIEKNERDLLIAADGGVRFLEQNGLTPDLIVGDFDSLGYVPEGEIVLHPVHKDETDLMLACREGLERGYRLFCLYGVLGGKRISHTFANVQLLSWLADQGAEGRLFGDGTEIRLLREQSLIFPKEQRGLFSLFALDGVAVVNEKGSLYELTDHRLDPHYPLGVSNEFCGNETFLSVTGADVLLVLEKTS